jgi:hypothetical protein
MPAPAAKRGILQAGETFSAISGASAESETADEKPVGSHTQSGDGGLESLGAQAGIPRVMSKGRRRFIATDGDQGGERHWIPAIAEELTELLRKRHAFVTESSQSSVFGDASDRRIICWTCNVCAG